MGLVVMVMVMVVNDCDTLLFVIKLVPNFKCLILFWLTVSPLRVVFLNWWRCDAWKLLGSPKALGCVASMPAQKSAHRQDRVAVMKWILTVCSVRCILEIKIVRVVNEKDCGCSRTKSIQKRFCMGTATSWFGGEFHHKIIELLEYLQLRQESFSLCPKGLGKWRHIHGSTDGSSCHAEQIRKFEGCQAYLGLGK